MRHKRKPQKQWLLVTIGLFLIVFVGKSCYNSHSDADTEDIALDQEVELHFDGRPKVGEPYLISVNSRRVRTYRMKIVGIDNPPYLRETHETHAVGELVYQSLDPLVIQFKIEVLEQTVDDKAVDYHPFSGMTAIIRGTSEGMNESLFIADESAVSFVPEDAPEGFRELLPGARRLIASMFASPLDHPEEYLGKSRKVKPGEKWNASAKPMLDAIKATGLELAPDQISATAAYDNASKIADIPARHVYFKAESVNVPGYDFKLEVFFTFPDESDAPLRIERTATEVVNHAIPEGVPGFSGSVMDCMTTDQSEVVMVRKSYLK